MMSSYCLEKLKHLKDLSIREISILMTMVLVIIWLGVYPNSFLKPIYGPVDKIINNYKDANNE